MVSEIVASVIVTTYNDERYIERALTSVLAQSTPFPFEIIVAEDCSTDGTRAVIERVMRGHEPRVIAMFADRNTGGTDNFRRAIERARGSYIAMVDGDDYWTSPEKLSKQVAFMRDHPQCSACFHNVEFFYEDGSKPPHSYNVPAPPALTTFAEILAGNFIAGPSPMFRQEIIDRIPRETYSITFADWAMHIVAAQHGPIGYIDEILAAHRIHSRGTWSRLDRIGQLVGILRFYEKIPTVLNERYDTVIQSHRERYCEVLAAAAALEWKSGRRSRSIAGWWFLCVSHPRLMFRLAGPFRRSFSQD